MRKIDKILEDKDYIQNLIDNGVSLKNISERYGYSRSDKLKKLLIKNGFEIKDKNGNIIKCEPVILKCKYCGKIFETKQKLAGHVTTCQQNPNYIKNIKNLEVGRKIHQKNQKENKQTFYCKFCGKEMYNKGAHVVHENACMLNPNRKPHPNGDRTYKNGRVAWNKGKTALTDERIMNATIKRKKSIEDGLYIPKGVSHTPESKLKLRKKMIAYIKKNGNGKFGQHHSKRGCDYIDKLNEEKHWNLQHALNGGEYEVCGYFLDGYDKELNIAFEYDEPKHYKDVYNNILSDRDVIRQKEIINFLKCEFYRYNEKLNFLYKV